MNFLTVILTSGNAELIERALYGLPEQENVVVLYNTNDTEKFSALKNRLSVEVVRTDSNGTPGMGHQSCFDYFLSTNYSHMIKLDGDDMFLPDGDSRYGDRPGGHRQIRHTMLNNPNTDVLGLLGEVVHYRTPRCQSFGRWSNFDYPGYMKYKDITPSDGLDDWVLELASYGGGLGYPFDRLVCCSRAGAAAVKYSTDLKVNEDTQLLCKLKLLHAQGVLVYNQFESLDCYYYNKMDGFSASDALYGNVDEWRRLFLSPFTEHEQEVLKSYRLPVVSRAQHFDNDVMFRVINNFGWGAKVQSLIERFGADLPH